MSYEKRMMNVPLPSDESTHHGYKQGHRDARHQCAEIAAEADAEIRRLRDALAVSEAGAAELREACENMLYVMARRGRLDDGDWATTKALVGNALSSNDAGKRVLAVVEAAREWSGIGPDGEQKLLDALDALNHGGG